MPIRVEIGRTELANGTVIVADLVKKTRHSGGRMIATRSAVTLDQLADVIKTIAANAKQQGRKRRAEDDAGSDKWTAILDMIDTEAPTDALAAAAAEAAAAVPPARKKDKGSKDKASGKAGSKKEKAGSSSKKSKTSEEKAARESAKKVVPESGRISFEAVEPSTQEASTEEHKKKKRRKKSKSAAAAASTTAE